MPTLPQTTIESRILTSEIIYSAVEQKTAQIVVSSHARTTSRLFRATCEVVQRVLPVPFPITQFGSQGIRGENPRLFPIFRKEQQRTPHRRRKRLGKQFVRQMSGFGSHGICAQSHETTGSGQRLVSHLQCPFGMPVEQTSRRAQFMMLHIRRCRTDSHEETHQQKAHCGRHELLPDAPTLPFGTMPSPPGRFGKHATDRHNQQHQLMRKRTEGNTHPCRHAPCPDHIGEHRGKQPGLTVPGKPSAGPRSHNRNHQSHQPGKIRSRTP